MRSISAAFAVVVGLLASGCKSNVENPIQTWKTRVYDGDLEAEPLSTYVDSDNDGLCDSSERLAGTSADNLDSDGDGFPDVVEVSYGLNALDPNVPRDEQVVSLVEASGAVATLTARVQVDGVGEQFTGLFESLDPFSSQNTTAADLLVGVRAVAANPPDNVHGIEENAARFASVQGLTELTFRIEFAYSDQPSEECIRGYPFNFSVKRPDRSQVGTERYMLVSTPTDTKSYEVSWCKPNPCL